MATWNVDKPAMGNQISADIPDIEENLQELHDVIEAITNGTLGTTTAANFRVDNPIQYSFSAKPTAAQTNIATGGVDVAFGTETFDSGGNFATPSFTAPIDGKYHYDVNLLLNSIDTAASQYVLAICVNGVAVDAMTMTPTQFAADVTYWPMGMSGILNLTATQTVKIILDQTGGAAQTGILTDSFFSMHFLHK